MIDEKRWWAVGNAGLLIKGVGLRENRGSFSILLMAANTGNNRKVTLKLPLMSFFVWVIIEWLP